MYYTLYIPGSVLYIIHTYLVVYCTLYIYRSIFYTLYAWQCIVNFTYLAVYYTRYNVESTYLAVYCTLYISDSVLYTIHILQYIVQTLKIPGSVLCIIHTVGNIVPMADGIARQV